MLATRPLKAIASVCLLAAGALAQSTARVSVDSQGAQANGESRAAAISADGRWIAFKSLATNLVPGDANALGDVFLHDRHTGTTSRVSLDSAGVEANGESFSPSVSLDGHWIAFHSAASNLVAGDANGRYDVFVRDRVAGTTVVVSVDSVGVLGNGDSDSPSICSDGSRVAFRSLGSNLVTGDVNNSADVFVYDFATGAPVLASADSAGVIANGDSGMPSLSGDGRWVAFASLATNLVPGDTNGLRDIFVHDLTTGSTVRASLSSASIQANGASDAPSISGDGRFVAFESLAGNLTAGDSNGVSDVFVRDLTSGSTVLASAPAGGGMSNGASSEASLSLDGRYVSFTGAANDLVSGDNNARDDIFVADRTAGTIELKSLGPNGLPGNGHSRASALSAGGRRVAFKSDATDLVAGDTNATADVFLRDTPSGSIYVDVQAALGGDGSVSAPFERIQVAITNPATVDLDTVLVQPGTYIETIDLTGKTIALIGTAGATGTIIDANRTGTGLRIASGEGIGTRIEGVTIRNGLAPCFDYDCNISFGGGMIVEGVTASLNNIIIEDCEAISSSALSCGNSALTMNGCLILNNVNSYGYIGGSGAVGLGSSFVSISNCIIEGNGTTDINAGQPGGGIAVYNCTGAIIGCSVRFNSSGVGSGAQSGGGVYIGGVTNPSFEDCTFLGNSTGENNGGGVAVVGSAIVTFTDCTFQWNRATYWGGGLCVENYGPFVPGLCRLVHCIFTGNRATIGAALTVIGDKASNLDILDSQFVKNVADQYSGSSGGCGGLLFSGPVAAQLTGCTVMQNTSPNGGGGVDAAAIAAYAPASVSINRCTITLNWTRDDELGGTGGVRGADLRNSIVWGNLPNDLGPGVNASWSDVGGIVPGVGNISADPLFWNVADVHLRPGSPCINAGDPNDPGDPDGSYPDMGAFAFDASHLGEAGTYCSAKPNSAECTPQVAFTGSTSLMGPDDFTISASYLLSNKSGILFWGSSPAELPFLGGTLCVHPPIIRTPVQSSGGSWVCGGTYTYLFSHAYMQSYLLGAGSTVYAQYWSRDPGFAPPDNVGLTDAVVFEISAVTRCGIPGRWAPIPFGIGRRLNADRFSQECTRNSADRLIS